MIPIVAEHGAELESLCRRYNVLRLELFGSAATGEYHPTDSDLDFLVESKSCPREVTPTPTSACWTRWTDFSKGPWTS